MKKIEKFLIPLGMVSSLVYVIHTILGNILWEEYNPVTMDISSLTAVGAPNRELLSVFTTIYGICAILFALVMFKKAFVEKDKMIKMGWFIFLIMELVSYFGYMFFPLTGDKTEMTFGNLMHIVVTIVVVFSTIASGFVLACGYLKNQSYKKLGRFMFVMAFLITFFGMLNPIGMSCEWNVLGLTERLVIYLLQLMTFVVSGYFSMQIKR